MKRDPRGQRGRRKVELSPCPPSPCLPQPDLRGLALIDRFLDRAARVVEIVLALAFLAAITLNFANVVGRYVLGASILWADEIQIFIMIAMTFIGAAVVTWRRQHLRMDVVARLLPAPVQALLKVVELLLVLVLTGFVMVQAADYTSRMYGIGRTSDTAGVPMWIPHGSVALGFALIALVALCLVVRLVRTGRMDDEPAPPGSGAG